MWNANSLVPGFEVAMSIYFDDNHYITGLFVYISECIYAFMLVCTVMKLLWLVYFWRRWQAFSLYPFTYAYYPDNAKGIAGIRSDSILFRDVIKPPANRKNYDADFRTSRKWRQHEMHNLEHKLFYYQPKNIKAFMWSKIVLVTKIKNVYSLTIWGQFT